MSQPISKIVPHPRVYLATDVLTDKPDFAILVSQIFATWAAIEQKLSFLLVHVLGASAGPALAMYSTLTAQHLQLGALEAAAKAAMSADDFSVFKAALSVADAVQGPRNHLAHWAWGGCGQRRDLLVLVDPKILRDRDFKIAALIEGVELETKSYADSEPSQMLAYSKADLERALRDLEECEMIIDDLTTYINPSIAVMITADLPDQLTRDQIRAVTLEQLACRRLFREALVRTRAVRKNSRPKTGG
jgi:hypothetical protein